MTDQPQRYDLIIIGTGSGNAIPDDFDDSKIAVVERDVFGGTCINRGCVPSKMFVLPADLAHEARNSARLGLDLEVGGADWAAIRDRVFGRIDQISVDGREYRAHGSPNITLIEATARFVAPKLLDIEQLGSDEPGRGLDQCDVGRTVGAVLAPVDRDRIDAAEHTVADGHPVRAGDRHVEPEPSAVATLVGDVGR